MASESDTHRLLKPVVILGTVTLTVVILGWAKMVFIPLALAILFTFILTPPVVWLRRKGVPRWPAALLITGLACVLVVGACSIVTLQVRDLIVNLPQHSKTIGDKIAALNQGDGGFFKPVVGAVQELYGTVQRGLSGETDGLNKLAEGATGSTEEPVEVAKGLAKPAEGAKDGTRRPAEIVQVVRLKSDYSSTIMGVAEPVLEMVVGIILIMVLVVFMLVSKEDLQYRLIRLVGHGHLTTTTRALDEAAERTSKFLLTQSIINVLFGTVLALGLCFLPVESILGTLPPDTPRHVPYAFLWGFLAAILRFIPYAGTWVALLFPLTLSVAVFPGWGPPLEVLGFYIVVELTVANFIEPLMLSHSTGISPIALLLAAAFWTWLWGPIGLVLATPLTVCLSVLGRHIPALSFLHTVLGSEEVLDLSNRFYQRLLAQDPDEAGDIVDEAVKKESVETVYDRVLVPALVMLQRDSQRGELSDEILKRALRSVAEIVDELAGAVQATTPAPAEPPKEKAHVCVLGCTTGDETDELALRMFNELVAASGYQMTLLSADKLSGEVLAQVEADKPSVVCIASLPPGGVARVSYLVKRLRARLPDLQILVGRWSQDDVVSAKQRLQSAGANDVSNSLLDTRKVLIPLLQHYSSYATAAAEKEAKLDHVV